MNESEFYGYTNKYLAAVELAGNLLLEHFGLNTKRELLESGKKLWLVHKPIGGLEFTRHGTGMCAESGNFYVDWDFSGAECEWCVIDPWFLYSYIDENGLDPNCSAKEVKAFLEKGVADGYFERAGNFYRLAVPKEQRFVPTFPEEYDHLEISQHTNRWTIGGPLAKQFTRKAVYVNNRVYNNPFGYTLKFIKDGKCVLELPYTDTDYPPNAVKIMTNQIINRLWKGEKL